MHAVLVTDEELATLNLPADRSRPRIVISVEGGLAQGFSTNGHGIDVTVLDYDEWDHQVTQADGGEESAYYYELTGAFDPEWVNSDILIGEIEPEPA